MEAFITAALPLDTEHRSDVQRTAREPPRRGIPSDRDRKDAGTRPRPVRRGGRTPPWAAGPRLAARGGHARQEAGNRNRAAENPPRPGAELEALRAESASSPTCRRAASPAALAALPPPPAPRPSRHLRGVGGRLPVPRRRRPRFSRDPDRPGRLVRHSVLLRPVGPLPPGRANQPQHRPGRPDRPREIRPRQVPRLPVHRIRPARLRPRRPQRRMDQRRRSRRRPGCQLAVGRPNRLNPLDEGPRPSESTTPPGSAGRSGRLDFSEPLPKPPWDGHSGPTERSALDAALADAPSRPMSRSCPLVVDALLDPRRALLGTTIEQAASRRARSWPRPRPAGPRRPRRTLRRALHYRLRPLPTHAQPRPVRHLRIRHAHRAGHDLHLNLAGSRPAPTRRRAPTRRLRRSLAAPRSTRPTRPYASPLEALPSLGTRQPHGRSPPVRPRRRRRLGSQARGLAQGLLADTATRILYNEPFDEAQAAGSSSGSPQWRSTTCPNSPRVKVSGGSTSAPSSCATSSPRRAALFSTDARMLAGAAAMTATTAWPKNTARPHVGVIARGGRCWPASPGSGAPGTSCSPGTQCLTAGSLPGWGRWPTRSTPGGRGDRRRARPCPLLGRLRARLPGHRWCRVGRPAPVAGPRARQRRATTRTASRDWPPARQVTAAAGTKPLLLGKAPVLRPSARQATSRGRRFPAGPLPRGRVLGSRA